MTIRTGIRWGALIVLPLLAACHSQPTIEATNSSTDAQLAQINATTNVTDGMDQGNDLLMAVPSTGQQMDAKPPPK